jgi:hypothetical protein
MVKDIEEGKKLMNSILPYLPKSRYLKNELLKSDFSLSVAILKKLSSYSIS